MSGSQQTTSAPTPTAANIYPPYPENPYRHETDWDIAPDKYEVNCTDYEVVEKHKHYKFGTTEVKEADFVVFLFEITGGLFKGKRISSSMMNVSMYHRSNLCGFLKGWLGREPETDFQPQSFVGMTATITVGVFPGTKKPDIKFPRITGIEPGTDTDEQAEGKPA